MPIPIKDEIARKLINEHFHIQPDMQDIYRFVALDEERPGEPIKLLEVTNSTPATGSVVTFTFGPVDDITFPSTIAQVTPEEMGKIRRGEIALPAGWDMARARRFVGPKRRRLKAYPRLVGGKTNAAR
jgi:hypothetical protein